jgi:hypothetical protein
MAAAEKVEPKAKVARTEPPLPQLPGDNSHAVAATGVLQQIVPWVLYNLPDALTKAKAGDIPSSKDIKQTVPLSIAKQAGTGKNEGATSGHSEVWSPSNFAKAFQAVGMYKASFHIFSIEPFPALDLKIPFDEFVFSDIIAQAEQLQPVQTERGRTILCPFQFWCWMSHAALPKEDGYPTAMHLLHGHPIIRAFYLKFMQAIHKKITNSF